MKHYEKIDAIFKRDMEGDKKIVWGDIITPEVDYLKNNIWEFTEKIDGTNMRVCWDGIRVSFRGRTDKAEVPRHLYETLNEMFGTPEAEEVFEQLFGEKEVIIFGEGYGEKVGKVGKQYRSGHSFIMFDVYIDGIWLKREAVESIAKALGVDVVPIILKGTISEGIEFMRNHPKSTIGEAFMEGLVGKPEVNLLDRTGERIIVKIKYSMFKEFK